MANTLQTLFLKLSKGDGRFCESCYSGRSGVGIKSLHSCFETLSFQKKCHGRNALEVILKEDAVVPGGFVGSLLAREDAEERRLQVLQEI